MALCACLQGVMEAITDRCTAMLRARANNQSAKGRVACVVALNMEEAPQMWQGCA